MIDLTENIEMCQGGTNMALYCDSNMKLTKFYINQMVFDITGYEEGDNYYIIKIKNIEYKIPNNLTFYKDTL
jgi:hypothetical protein